MKLILPISINIILVIIFHLLERVRFFAKLPYIHKQIIIGVIFGGSSCFASSFGVEILETVANIRDAAPLSAGLIFGAPSGIISGLIGGLYRWFAVYWGAGHYTRLACAIATMLAGVMAAALRKFMFDNKKPTLSYAIAITILCEVVHMLLILITNIRDTVYAFEFVKGATMPMIIGNAVAVSVSLITVSLISGERVFLKKGKEHIAETFQRWLLFCIMVAFVVTSLFTYFLQDRMVSIETRNTFETAISDVVTDVRGKSDSRLLEIAKRVKAEYENNRDISLTELMQRENVVEINVINDNGDIIKSTNESYIGTFNMNESEQSGEFMVLTKDKDSLVQPYGPIGLDGTTMRKYAGLSLEGGGFIQVGYSAEQFHSVLDQFVVDVTQNRSVGTTGFVAVCDENLNLVTNDAWNKLHISSIGIIPNENMLAKKSSDKLYETEVTNKENDFSREYIYAFTFVEGYCIIAAMPESDAMFMRDSSVYNSLFMQVLVFATLFVFIYILIKRVIINNLKRINGTLAEIADGNLEVTVDVRSTQEFASLSDDINSTVSTLKRYISEAAARIDKELEYAKQIQNSALPKNFPRDSDHEIYAHMIAAKEVGGDFYDFYKLSDDTVAFLVADVSGKGIPAAMFMMTAKTIIKDLAEGGLEVNEIFTRANEKLCETNESGMFVTAWMGILDLKSGRLQYANAGHNPPLIKRADGKFEYLRSRAGFVLAGMGDVKYRANEITLAPGDRVLLYTDGVPEATNSANEFYGEDRLERFINGRADLGARDMLFALKADIDDFAGEAPQFDDITMLLFDYKPKIEMKNVVKRVFPARVEALDDLISFLEEQMENYSCPLKMVTAVCVAVEEVFVNVAHYAYGEGEGDVDFSVGFDSESDSMIFRMADRGTPFDPLENPDPDITLSAEDREIGGLGIFITKKTMDSVSYSYENGENVLIMIKKIKK